VKQIPAGETLGEFIRGRLSGSIPVTDPTRIELSRQRRWPASWQAGSRYRLRPAGVLIPVIERAAGPTVLLTRRSAELAQHPGQVSFPGGSMERSDADIVATALRETAEEVGVTADRIEIAGALRTMPTITGFVVTPVVGLLQAEVRLTLDPSEVDLAFEVPLGFFLDRANERRTERLIEGVPVPLLEYFYGGERIWGATAAMLAEFRRKIFEI